MRSRTSTPATPKLFADEIRQATNGRLDITVHSNGSLFKLSEIKRAVQTGQVPIAEVSLPFYGNEYPFFEMDVVLFLARTYPEAREALERLAQIRRGASADRRASACCSSRPSPAWA